MRHTVLVVEDNVAILKPICEYLSHLGYLVDGCVDGKAARRRVEQRNYSIVLTDLRLRDGNDFDGLVLAEFVNTRRPGTPVIVLTACGDPDAELKAIRCGVARVLNKPQPLAQIASVVQETLSVAYARFL
jgi:two-component system, NtrC family, response regulator PilR